jgi:hypothetical protein
MFTYDAELEALRAASDVRMTRKFARIGRREAARLHKGA